jgi:hypothetical protein
MWYPMMIFAYIKSWPIQEILDSYTYRQTHDINAPNGVGDGFTASGVGFKIFLFWTVSFTDGTE